MCPCGKSDKWLVTSDNFTSATCHRQLDRQILARDAERSDNLTTTGRRGHDCGTGTVSTVERVYVVIVFIVGYVY